MIAAAKIKELQKLVALHDNPSAYKELFIGFYNPLLEFAINFFHVKEEAEEIVSDVFINIWQHRRSLQQISNLKVYLYIAVRNRCLNYIVKQKRKHLTSLDLSAIEIKSVYLNPEELMITAEMTNRIRDAIQLLPPKCRMIFNLVKENNLKHKEAAQILQVSVKTIESQITIAVKKIGTAINFDIKKAIPASSGYLT